MEVTLGCRLEPVGTLAQVHRVQVFLEDVAFRIPAFEFDRESQLARLPLEGPFPRGSEEGVLHVLLSDSAPALDDLAFVEIDDRGPGDGADVVAGMPVEASVFGRENGLLGVFRNSLQTHQSPIAPRSVEAREEGSVGGTDRRA
jgi:hypothetical protein